MIFPGAGLSSRVCTKHYTIKKKVTMGIDWFVVEVAELNTPY